jgi:hypothetical protein
MEHQGDLLDRRLIDHPLFYRWGADSQKLYYWLRRHVCRGEAGAVPEALSWHGRGYLCTYATADMLMEQAVPVSKNTLTKLVAELRTIGVVQTRTMGRGYIFLLGEWLHRPGQDDLPFDLYFEAFYLEARLADASAPSSKRIR